MLPLNVSEAEGANGRTFLRPVQSKYQLRFSCAASRLCVRHGPRILARVLSRLRGGWDQNEGERGRVPSASTAQTRGGDPACSFACPARVRAKGLGERGEKRGRTIVCSLYVQTRGAGERGEGCAFRSCLLSSRKCLRGQKKGKYVPYYTPYTNGGARSLRAPFARPVRESCSRGRGAVGERRVRKGRTEIRKRVLFVCYFVLFLFFIIRKI